MNPRLQRRCLVTSLVVHGLLLALILVAPGFQKSRPDLLGALRPLELLPGELIDAALGMAPPPEPEPEPEPVEPVRQEPVMEPPPPVPPPKATPRPEVPVVIPEVTRPNVATPPRAKPAEKKPAPPVEKKAPPVEKKAPKLDFSKAKAVPDTARKSAAKVTPSEDSSRQRMAALAKQMAQRTGDLERSASGAVNVQLSAAGGGGGGGGSANALHVRNAYDAAWVLPVGVTDAGATAEVEVVLRGDGTVVSARVVRKSGVAALDRSVEAALKKVKQVRPFESFAKDEQVTYLIDFNQRSRRTF